MRRITMGAVLAGSALVGAFGAGGPAEGGGPLCNGREVTVNLADGETPTAGDDVIYGRPGPETINAGGGEDLICSRGGRDVVNGGAETDVAYLGDGNDVFNGGAGNDRPYGGAGADTLNGQAGDDYLVGQRGRDTGNGGAAGTDYCFTEVKSGCEG